VTIAGLIGFVGLVVPHVVRLAVGPGARSVLPLSALFGASLFAFFHLLIGPTSGYLSQLSYQGWLAAMGVFAAFGAFTVLFWAWFRFRPSPATEGSSEV